MVLIFVSLMLPNVVDNLFVLIGHLDISCEVSDQVFCLLLYWDWVICLITNILMCNSPIYFLCVFENMSTNIQNLLELHCPIMVITRHIHRTV